MAYRTTSWKNTDIGQIPKDWEVDEIGAFVKLQGGYSFKSDTFTYKGTYVIRISDINNDIIDLQDAVCVNTVVPASFLVGYGDILIAMSGATTGKIGIYNNVNPSYLNQRVGKFSIYNEKLSQSFLAQFVKSNYFKYKINGMLEAGAQPNISGKQIESIIVSYPQTVEEQQKIATVLTDLDDLIAELEKVRDKKQAIKIGAMQELLTGKRRLPGFNKPWKEVELGEVGRFYSGLTGKTKGDFDFGQPFIKYNDVSNFYRIPTKLTAFVNVSEQENQNEVSYGDVFFTASSETAEEAGLSSVLLYQPITNTYLNSFCLGFRINDFNSFIPMFASYYLRSDFVRKQICLLAQGTGIRYNLSRTKLVGLKLHIPTDKSEQEVIANILSDMDDEISAINDKINKYKQIKAGVADELLSGRIRLIKPQE